MQTKQRIHRPTKPNNFLGTEEEFLSRRKHSFDHKVDYQYVDNKRNELASSKNALNDVRRIQNKIDFKQDVNELSRDVNSAIRQQENDRLQRIAEYKTNTLNALRTIELLSSGVTLLGMYSRLNNWKNSANALKRGTYNLLTKSQLPLTYTNTGIDLAQTALTYPDVSTKDYLEFGGDGTQIIGASDVFRNTRMFNKYGTIIDNGLDGIGGLTAGGDIVTGLWDFGNNVYEYVNSQNK